MPSLETGKLRQGGERNYAPAGRVQLGYCWNPGIWLVFLFLVCMCSQGYVLVRTVHRVALQCHQGKQPDKENPPQV